MTAEANNMLYELLMHDPRAKADGHRLDGTKVVDAFNARFSVPIREAFGLDARAKLASIEAELDARVVFRTQHGQPVFVLASAIRKATKSKSLVVSASASGSSPSAKVKRANGQLFAQLAASSNPTEFIPGTTLGQRFKQRYKKTLRQAFGGSFVSLLDERFETRRGSNGHPHVRIKPGMVAREQVQETTVEVKGVPVVYSSSAADAEEVLFGERSDGAKVSTVMVDFERDTNDDTVLVQIYVGSTGGPKCYIFDTQRSPHRFFGEGGPIRKLLASTNTFKVIHDCRADIRSLSSRHGVNKVRSIVDTQVLFADLDPSVPEPGFNTILKTLKLKSHELKESMDHRRWGDRPLSRMQLEYAALDVILLAKAFRKLRGDFHDRWPSVIQASTERAQSNIRKPKPPTAAAPAPSSADSADTDAKHGSPAGKPEFLAFLKNWEPTRHATWPECEADIEASRGGAAMSLPPLDSIQAQEENSLLAVLPERVSQALRSYDESGRFSLSNLVDVSMDVGELPEALFSVPELLMDEGDSDAADDPLANPSEDLFTASDTAETWKSYPVALHEAGVLTQEDIESVLQHDMTTKVDPTTARAGISGTLHRVGVIFDSENAVGLTVRMGRAIMDPGNALADLLRDGKSALLIGRPGMGKTTMLRGIARMLADAPLNKRVIVVDTSGEIAGQGRTKHPCIGRARRIPVNRKEDQAKLLDQAVINHTPACMIIDEISTSKEVRSVRGIAQRGVQMIASVHGSTLADVVSNPDTCDLVGGAKTIIWGDQEMRARGRKSKVERQREKKPAFDVCVEVHGRGQWVVHANVKHAVDCILAGDSFVAERRRLLRDAERHVYTVEDHALYPVVTQPVVQHFLGSSEA